MPNQTVRVALRDAGSEEICRVSLLAGRAESVRTYVRFHALPAIVTAGRQAMRTYVCTWTAAPVNISGYGWEKRTYVRTGVAASVNTSKGGTRGKTRTYVRSKVTRYFAARGAMQKTRTYVCVGIAAPVNVDRYEWEKRTYSFRRCLLLSLPRAGNAYVRTYVRGQRLPLMQADMDGEGVRTYALARDLPMGYGFIVAFACASEGGYITKQRRHYG